MPAADYRRARGRPRAVWSAARRAPRMRDLAVVTNDAAAERRADIWLQDLWAGRESAEFALPPSAARARRRATSSALTVSGRRRAASRCAQIIDTESAQSRRARSTRMCSTCRSPRRAAAPPVHAAGARTGAALVLELPTLAGATSRRCWRGSRCSPIRGRDRSRSGVRVDGSSFERDRRWRSRPRSSARRSTICRAGPTSRWDMVAAARACSSTAARSRRSSDGAVLDGANAAAVQRARRRLGGAAVRQCRTGRRAHLSSCRGCCAAQVGSEWAMAAPLPAGAPFRRCSTRSGADRARPRRRSAARMQLAHRRGQPRPRRSERGRDLTATPQATALLPLAPVHLKARARRRRRSFRGSAARAASPATAGRRGAARRGQRSLRARILSGATVVRTLSATTPTCSTPRPTRSPTSARRRSSFAFASLSSPPPSAAAFPPPPPSLPEAP